MRKLSGVCVSNNFLLKPNLIHARASFSSCFRRSKCVHQKCLKEFNDLFLEQHQLKSFLKFFMLRKSSGLSTSSHASHEKSRDFFKVNASSITSQFNVMLTSVVAVAAAFNNNGVSMEKRER
ncbi:CLUMA_CG019685, isoform A [Clunio marinus]|uniref:CLUMA_CG019685, isoform A n=1 Tax=Clunio marinus TaxID=568069 RepID=A0A1J1J238_9DIPT|nr:CLUMA_CG019685, isoform A [Clunio marinus]